MMSNNEFDADVAWCDLVADAYIGKKWNERVSYTHALILRDFTKGRLTLKSGDALCRKIDPDSFCGDIQASFEESTKCKECESRIQRHGLVLYSPLCKQRYQEASAPGLPRFILPAKFQSITISIKGDAKKFMEIQAIKHGISEAEVLCLALEAYRFLKDVKTSDGKVVLKRSNGELEHLVNF